ncbi:MAG: hypothetical protein LBT50_02575 [Prevotellaceae bacterium]|jgi:hypothetical protein|nr:hypothetical protein [Prevotellaceae bacterium]
MLNKIFSNPYRVLVSILLITRMFLSANAQDKTIYPVAGADEKTPSRSQYFTWVNNTNEGATEQQTLINLEFFEWLNKEYGMALDIYAFDAGLIDGARFYGSIKSDRFRERFPNGLEPVYRKAKSINTRLGSWGGPDGFGDTPQSVAERKEMMISLCRDYEWALFKFDGVCGPLRKEKANDFIEMMQKGRSYSPDLILLNHRLNFYEGMPYATTFLWEGAETYIDVHYSNSKTAPHNRAGVLSRGLVPRLQRLTEDHGVCLSSCLDYWDDDLILQAFNRSLILAPEIYGNPWLLNDREFPKLARIYNLHRKFRDILVDGIVLPDSYGMYPVSRGDAQTRLITLRNLEWTDREQTVRLNEEIGLTKGKTVQVKIFHPVEKIVGTYRYGENIKVTIPAFRSLLLFVSTDNKYSNEPGIEGVDYEVVKNIPGSPVEIRLLGLPGTSAEIKLPKGTNAKKITIDGQDFPLLAAGKSVKIQFDGVPLKHPYHRKLVDLSRIDPTGEATDLYEATVFAADNNALEVRSLKRSGATEFPAVKAARDAFFNQQIFINRGVWDKNLFDEDMTTGFWPVKRGRERRVKDGCFRLDLGREMLIDSVIIKVNDNFSLEPLVYDVGAFANISSDLKKWKSILYIANKHTKIAINDSVRYLKLNPYPSAISEIEVYSGGKKADASGFRASNLFADSKQMKCIAMWTNSFVLSEIAENSYLSVAINGKHGEEGAYAAIKIDGKPVGSPSRARSFPSNTWEHQNSATDSNYTYYFPLDESVINKKIEVFVMGYNSENVDIKPEVWISAYPVPYKEKRMSYK